MKIRILTVILSLAATLAIAAPGYLGVNTEPVSEVLAAQLGLEAGQGLVVTSIDPKSPAKIMLKKHDILTEFDGVPLTGHEQLSKLIGAQEADTEVDMKVLRGGKTVDTSVVLGAAPKGKPAPDLKAPAQPPVPGAPFNFGLDLHADVDLKKLLEQWSKNMQGFGSDMQGFGADMDEAKKMMEEMQKNLADQMKLFQFKGNFDFPFNVQPPQGGGPMLPGFQGQAQHSSSVTVNQNGLSVTLTDENGDRHLKAKAPDGTVLFDGPVNTDDEIKKIPPDVKAIYDNMKVKGGGIHFNFKGPKPRPPQPKKPRGIII